MLHAPALIIASATVVGLLGGLHLLFTIHGNRFDPRDDTVAEALKVVSPVISRRTTMARAAKGFHASRTPAQSCLRWCGAIWGCANGRCYGSPLSCWVWAWRFMRRVWACSPPQPQLINRRLP